MLRFPSISVDETTGRGSYSSSKDRELVIDKMRAVLRIFQSKAVKKVVLGAWGCGAYGNPVGEVAAAWKKVLLGGRQAQRSKKGRRALWTGIETVVFAIKDAGLADAFGQAFGDGLVLDDTEDISKQEESGDDLEAEKLREMQEKIAEMKSRIEHAKSPELKGGLTSIVASLESQVAESPIATGPEHTASASDDDESESGDESSDSDIAYNSNEE
jgi:hypothetical protein